MPTIDTKEIHKVVEDSDRFDTSDANSSVTLQYQDNEEVNVIAEYQGTTLSQTIPGIARPFFIVFNPSTSGFRGIKNLSEELEEGDLFVSLVK